MLKNFDFSWFLTTPGILTGLGCLLIVVSIIIFISSLSGKKKKNKEEQVNTDVQIPDVSGGVETTTPVTPEVTPVEVAQTPVTPEVTPVEVAQTPVTPEVTPVEVAQTPVTPEVTPVEVTQTPVTPEVTPVEVAQTPVTPEVTPVEVAQTPVTPEVAPVEVTQTPVTSEVASVEINPPATESLNTEQNQQVGFSGINIEPNITPVEMPTSTENATNSNDTPEPTVYGGVSPKVENVQQEEAPKVIYGGADPLAGTGIIPAVSQNTNVAKEDIESL